MRLKNAQVFDEKQGFITRDICIHNERIAAESEGGELSLSGCYLIPGLIDLHLHGCRGADVSDASKQGLATMSSYLLSRGVTQFCPSSVTLCEKTTHEICATVASLQQKPLPGAELLGLYLEGPFLSAKKAGAHNPASLKSPNVDLVRRLQSSAKGLIQIVAVAPEQKGAMAFIEALKDEVILSLAHSACTYEEAMAAFEHGAKQVTHLFNAMSGLSHRDPGLVGAAADFGCYAELICDGIHVHPAVVRLAFRLFGAQRVILISDSMRATGMPNGEYSLGDKRVYVCDGRATLKDGTLAGSVTDLMECLLRAVSFGIPLQDAVTAATVNPAKALGLYKNTGSLHLGKLANIVVLKKDLTLHSVYYRGQQQRLR